ncbi:MAG: HEAT repeat domain-containing protein [Candidatus Lokiarchaeota archaeon]|nr:HEAT repeat domain-containing protein [Candidatus Harpocratesius repetitus]
MEQQDLIILGIYAVIFLITFLIGFLMVRKNLAEINRIEKEKFDLGDYGAMISFGLMFGLSLLFICNLILEVIQPGEYIGIAGYILTTMLIILVIYPLWEAFFLGRPTSDSVHDFHKFLESKILDRFQGTMAYVVSFIIFIVIYIVPIILIWYFSSISIAQVAFMWFLIFPLFFLNYFASQGQVSGIIQATYRKNIPKEIISSSHLGQSTMKRVLNIFFIIIAWTPFVLSFYNFFNPILKAINGYTFTEKDKMMGYLSILTTVPFGIKGFFQKFWNKKAKTKIIDYIFGGYIFISLAVNMLLNFVQIEKAVVTSIFQTNLLLAPIQPIFENYSILVPLIVVQSFITIVFGTYTLLQRNSDFHSDIRLQATSLAYGDFEIAEIIKATKSRKSIKSKSEKAIEKELEDQKKNRKGKKQTKTKDKKSKIKHDILTLYKSILLPSVYSEHGVDLNEQIRLKAEQYLYLIAIENQEEAEKIVSFLFKMSLNSEQYQNNLMNRNKFNNREAIGLLGEIGAEYPNIVLERLIKALSYNDIRTQRHILDALGDIGETKENLLLILGKIRPLLVDKRTEVRTAAFQAITEMVLEGQNQDKEFVGEILRVVYGILNDEFSNSEAIDSAFEALVQMSAKIADDLSIEKIVPFLEYNEGNDKDTIEYIIQNALVVLSYMVYYNIDTFPLEKVRSFLKDERSFLRYVAADAVGNYILKGPEEAKEEILVDLMIMALHDPDIDVVQMCAESIAEFLIMNKNYEPTIDGNKISIIDYFTRALTSSEPKVAENASEALKMISPMYDEIDIYPRLEPHLNGDNLELIRDCLHVIALSDSEEHLSANLEIIYKLTRHHDASVRDKAVYTLGMISKNRPDIDEKIVFERLDDEDPQVRQEAIFALGKIGIKKPLEVTPELIQRFFQLDKESEQFISEIELYAESLGVIGSHHPSNEIIISLQATLMGDTNVFAKDVIARALGAIGHGMIKSGVAIRRIEDEAFLNRISWLKIVRKKEYTIGNLIIFLIEALQLKGIPNSVMNEISDAIQDLLPVFLFAKYEDEDPTSNKTLEIIKKLLAQAYYANYNNEILETIDRIDSMISFKKYFEEKDPRIKDQFLFYAKQYTPDGKQFFDQGNLFSILAEDDPTYLAYALKSYEIAVDLSPYEYYTPSCLLKMGEIYRNTEEYKAAEKMFAEALELFSSMDEVDQMKYVEDALSSVRKNLSNTAK